MNLIEDHWLSVKDGDPRLTALHQRHYSHHHYRDGRRPRKVIGPGEYMALLTVDARAGWIWRKFHNRDGNRGINCAFFRNEGPLISSTLILEACTLAWSRWPAHRLYTYVNPRAIQSTNPGYCFKVAGWKICGTTSRRKLLILEKLPPDGSD